MGTEFGEANHDQVSITIINNLLNHLSPDMGLTIFGIWWGTRLTWTWCRRTHCAESEPMAKHLQCDVGTLLKTVSFVAPKKHILLLFRHIGALKMAAGRAHRSNAGAKMAGLLDKEVDFPKLRDQRKSTSQLHQPGRGRLLQDNLWRI